MSDRLFRGMDPFAGNRPANPLVWWRSSVCWTVFHYRGKPRGRRSPAVAFTRARSASSPRLSHLRALEAESIHIFREVAAELERPVMLYSIGKDSAVLAHLAQKAFAPAPIPFPLLHIDTTWKFRDMIAFLDRFARDNGLDRSSSRRAPPKAA